MLLLLNLIAIFYMIILFSKKYPISLSMYWLVIFYAIYIFIPMIRHQTVNLSYIPDNLVDQAAMYSLLGLLSFILTNSFFLLRSKKLGKVDLKRQTKILHNNVKKILLFFIFISIILMFLSIGIKGIVGIFSSGSREIWLFQTNNTILSTFAELSLFYVGITASVLVLSAGKIKDRKKAIKIFIGILIIISILAFARRHVIYPLSAVLFYKLSKSVKKIKILTFSLLLFPVFFLLMYLTGYFRTFGIHNFDFDSILSYFKSSNFIDIFLSNTDFAASYKYFIDQLDYGNIFVGPIGYFKLLFVLIPRSIWPDKPEYTSVEILSILEPLKVSEGFSAASGYLGEAHAALGVGGIVIVSSLWGFFCGLLDKKYQFIIRKRESLQNIKEGKFGFTIFEFYYIYVAILLITESHRGDFGAASIHYLLEVVLIGVLLKFISKKYAVKDNLNRG